MDPNITPTPGFEMPKPPGQGEWQSAPTGAPNPNTAPNTAPGEVPQATELSNIEMPLAGPGPAAPPGVITPLAPPPPMQAPLAQPPVQPAPAPIAISSDLTADDSDLIEKEWVLKAKAIVNQTRQDPYMQNKEMNKVKADYLKKRYNKDIKLSDE